MHYAALHPGSRALLDSWQALNGMAEDAAEAGDTARLPGDPPQSDTLGMVDRLFLAQRMGAGVFSFRTVGRDLKIWAGRDLRDHDVAHLFHGADRGLIRALLESAVASPGPALARVAAFGAGAGQRQDLELVFLPLIERGSAERILGLFQPLAPRPRVSRPVLRFALTALLPPNPAPPARPALRLVTSG
jgi:hypothetical protein